LTAAPFFIRNLISSPPSDTLRLASFGAGGMAYATLHGIGTHSKVKVACVAEVDSARLTNLKRNYDSAKVYDDWRQMIDTGPHARGQCGRRHAAWAPRLRAETARARLV
jgi:shikimate 5-dehydrogenase